MREISDLYCYLQRLPIDTCKLYVLSYEFTPHCVGKTGVCRYIALAFVYTVLLTA